MGNLGRIPSSLANLSFWVLYEAHLHSTSGNLLYLKSLLIVHVMESTKHLRGNIWLVFARATGHHGPAELMRR